tara:strand:- start:37670 stop:37993 length:324 start_codon:yes stop_codon:yes gene_type:complete
MKVDVELLRRLRAQMLIHCYLYYWMDSPIWTDGFWQSKADALQKLQEGYLEAGLSIDIGFYDDAFRDFTGATGAHLPRDDYVVSKAIYIYRLHTKENVDFNSLAGVK